MNSSQPKGDGFLFSIFGPYTWNLLESYQLSFLNLSAGFSIFLNEPLTIFFFLSKAFFTCLVYFFTWFPYQFLACISNYFIFWEISNFQQIYLRCFSIRIKNLKFKFWKNNVEIKSTMEKKAFYRLIILIS